ncbi:Ribosomal RNA small subunit methyltransferase H [Salinivirga cyanobacteriivorans]|uniref:Ribosomal RNA small subunit methyltransferase H n=1 Tax=Salinivirga cyanobacteriivorans TaxID=1307839 RepID=A0A0S2HYK9_9BACT|nr:16S rRNA (cytosine(1402)-N(4))-methyltransferase RsmH [Salinivirga cyanobacteriivorans]ALO15159.1 Ribosomal RNA small subunit methyltransferase H [Salinivirga cyanobacteriivorans]
MKQYHTPALLQACIDGLQIDPSGTYVDATFGGGGHSAAILKKLNEGHLFGFDQDDDALKNAPEDVKFTFVHQNFRFLKHFMRFYNVNQLDGILADLGVSFHHFDTADRGFSFRYDAKLDMRMNQRAALTAEKVINEYAQEELMEIFRTYGELRNARKLAQVIIQARTKERIELTGQLKELIAPLFPRKAENKFLARFFQAIRIEVNQEIPALKSLLIDGTRLLKPGGRFAIITYHSIEDRLVKNYFKSGNLEGHIKKDFYGNPEVPYKVITRNVIVPDEDEIKQNPRSRSAKLRIAEKK